MTGTMTAAGDESVEEPGIDIDARFAKESAAETPGRAAWNPGSVTSASLKGLGSTFPVGIVPSTDFRSIMPSLDLSDDLAPHLQSLQTRVATDFTSVVAPVLDTLRNSMVTSGVLDSVRSVTAGLRGQFDSVLADLRTNLKPLVDPGFFEGINRRMLPPNLRSASDQIKAVDVRSFVESEAIPLYLIPRADIGVRLLRAPNKAARRQVLSDRFEALVQDCTVVIDRSDDPMVATAVHFVRDGLGALSGGHYASAQAIFTLVLDTLIMEIYPDRQKRTKITNRRRDNNDVPPVIETMGLRESYVWLTIWNAHLQFWKDKGDPVPYPFSRHASVHGASRRQYSKRNCVQVLMLVTSLIGYADQLVKEHRAKNLSA